MIPAKEIDGELWVRAADVRIKKAAEQTLQCDLRDYFAAKAMQIILQDQYQDGIYINADNESHETCATSAYMMADAMMKEREK